MYYDGGRERESRRKKLIKDWSKKNMKYFIEIPEEWKYYYDFQNTRTLKYKWYGRIWAFELGFG